jgi:hypothetical protein
VSRTTVFVVGRTTGIVVSVSRDSASLASTHSRHAAVDEHRDGVVRGVRGPNASSPTEARTCSNTQPSIVAPP